MEKQEFTSNQGVNNVSFDLFDSETNSGDDYSLNSSDNEIKDINIADSDGTSDLSSTHPLVWNINSDSSNAEVIPKIIRHVLEDSLENSINESNSQVILSPEEQQKKSDERNAKIHAYTSKLKNPNGISEFENEPAFVRRNIQIDINTPSNENNVSRFGLSDDQSGSGLRNNNFLHDNVD